MANEIMMKRYSRKITPVESVLSYSPFSIVTLVARIKGNVSVEELRDAVEKVQRRHTNLRVRITEDKEYGKWFTTENVGDIPVEKVERLSDDHWISVQHDATQEPFQFDEKPAIRFILVHSPSVSELIILCHHVICDGLSLAYLARDIMVHLGDPTLEPEILPDPTPIDLDNMPKEVSMGRVTKFFINRINRQWRKTPVYFDQEDYENLNQAYWSRAQHRIISIELTEAQTNELVQRCKEEKATVNSALTTAFAGAQRVIQGGSKELSSLGIAGNLRDRLQKPAGETMGFFAGVVTLDYTYDVKRSFWENARRFNEKVQPMYTNKNLFKDGLGWCYLDPGVLEAINFKKIGGLVSGHASRYEKLSAYSKRDDVISGILKREKMQSLDRIMMGTAVTNLIRMDFPRQYGEYELDRLIMNPGGAFPLSNVNMVVGAVTCSGKLSLIMEYDEGTVDTETMNKIKEKSLEFLFTQTNN